MSQANFRELLKPQAIIPAISAFYPTAELTKPRWLTYGLGWFQQDYRGRFVAMHTGPIDGRTAIIALVPDEKVGVNVFGNLDHAEFRHALMWRMIDACLGAPSRDWSAEFLKLDADRKADADKKVAEREARRVKDTRTGFITGLWWHRAFLARALERAALCAARPASPVPPHSGRRPSRL